MQTFFVLHIRFLPCKLKSIFFKGFLLFVIFPLSFSYSETNPWDLGIFERILNRKNVSHIVLETRPDHFRVTLIVSDRFPYNYKSRSYHYFLRAENAKEAKLIADDLDLRLTQGLNLKLFLKGTEISRYIILENEK